MTEQKLIMQPNGLLGVFSRPHGDFLCINLTVERAYDFFVLGCGYEHNEAKVAIKTILDDDANQTSWSEIISVISDTCNEKLAEKRKEQISASHRESNKIGRVEDLKDKVQHNCISLSAPKARLIAEAISMANGDWRCPPPHATDRAIEAAKQISKSYNNFKLYHDMSTAMLMAKTQFIMNLEVDESTKTGELL